MNALAAVPTLVDYDRSAQLAAIASSGACEAGKVIMLDFSVVREKVAARWHARREAIWDHTERTLKRHVQATAIFCRADQTNYLISFADMGGFGAQALGFRIMQDVITHFIGVCSPEDLLVKTVSSIDDSEITAAPVAFRAEHLTHIPSLVVAVTSSRQPMPALTQVIDGQFQQSLGFDHVFNLKLEKPVALRVSSELTDYVTQRPLKPQEMASLSTRALLEADAHTFKMLDYVFTDMPPKLVIAPISIHTLTITRSRTPLLNFLNTLDCDTRGRFVIEVYGLEDGTPASRLADTMNLVRPFCRSVMARTTSSRLAISNIRAARVPAVNICAPETGGSNAKLAASLLASGEAARGLAAMLMVTELPSSSFLPVCAVAGFTHASVKPVPSALDV